MDDVKRAFLEANGEISIVKYEDDDRSKPKGKKIV